MKREGWSGAVGLLRDHRRLSQRNLILLLPWIQPNVLLWDISKKSRLQHEQGPANMTTRILCVPWVQTLKAKRENIVFSTIFSIMLYSSNDCLDQVQPVLPLKLKSNTADIWLDKLIIWMSRNAISGIGWMCSDFSAKVFSQFLHCRH